MLLGRLVNPITTMVNNIFLIFTKMAGGTTNQSGAGTISLPNGSSKNSACLVERLIGALIRNRSHHLTGGALASADGFLSLRVAVLNQAARSRAYIRQADPQPMTTSLQHAHPCRPFL